MEQRDLDHAVKVLSDGIHEIKLNTEILVTKLEQVNSNIQKLESSVEDLHMSLSEQDRRLTILEQAVPKDLIQDVALIKQNQATIGKLLWLLGGATLATVSDMIIKMVTK
jgi:DNA polymerase III sliding clamp (beta) subunit (PCNA family)